MSNPFRVAVVQYQPETHAGATRNNLARMAEIVERVAAQNVKLVVFPELGTCGYGIETDAVEDAVGQQEEVISKFSELALKHDLYVVASYPTRSSSTVSTNLITASIFLPSGDRVCTYDKTHPWAASPFEQSNFALGRQFKPAVALPEPWHGAWLNALICWDIEFPEPARATRLALSNRVGSHAPLILAVPTANADASVAEYILRARARENGLYLLYANHAGEGFCGGSCILSPDGEVLAAVAGDAEGLAMYDLDLDLTKAHGQGLVGRRPELYGVLTEGERWVKPSWSDDTSDESNFEKSTVML